MGRRSRTAAVAAVLLVAGLAAGALRDDGPRSDPRFLGWAPRGSLATDEAAVGQAVRTWDYGVSFRAGEPDPASPPSARRPHTDVRVLYAEAVPGGQAIVTEGRAQDGRPELGLFFTATSAPADLRFTAKRVVEPRLGARHVAFVVLNRTGAALLVVVGEPGTTGIAYATEAAPGVLVPMRVTYGTATGPGNGVARIVLTGTGGTVYDGPVSDSVVAPDAVL